MTVSRSTRVRAILAVGLLGSNGAALAFLASCGGKARATDPTSTTRSTTSNPTVKQLLTLDEAEYNARDQVKRDGIKNLKMDSQGDPRAHLNKDGTLIYVNGYFGNQNLQEGLAVVAIPIKSTADGKYILGKPTYSKFLTGTATATAVSCTGNMPRIITSAEPTGADGTGLQVTVMDQRTYALSEIDFDGPGHVTKGLALCDTTQQLT